MTLSRIFLYLLLAAICLQIAVVIVGIITLQTDMTAVFAFCILLLGFELPFAIIFMAERIAKNRMQDPLRYVEIIKITIVIAPILALTTIGAFFLMKIGGSLGAELQVPSPESIEPESALPIHFVVAIKSVIATLLGCLVVLPLRLHAERKKFQS